jgi:hypothetical protein
MLFLNKIFFLYFIMPRHTGKGGGRAGAGRGRAGGNGRGRGVTPRDRPPPPTPRTQRAMRSIPRGTRTFSQVDGPSAYGMIYQNPYAPSERGSQGTVRSAPHSGNSSDYGFQPTSLYRASRDIVRRQGIPVDIMKQGRTGFAFPSRGRGFAGNNLPRDMDAVRNRVAAREAAAMGATGLARAAQQRRGRAAASAAAAKARSKKGNGKKGNGKKGGKK